MNARATERRIVTVTPNPAVDITYRIRRLVPGQGHRVGPLIRAGGKGLNVARVVHQLGYPVLAVAPVGGHAGAQFREELARSGLAHRLVEVGAEIRRSMAVVETDEDRTTIFNEFGTCLAPEEWSRIDSVITSVLAETDATPTGVVVGSGSLPEGAPRDFYPRLVSMAHRYGAAALIDTSGEALLDAAAAGADLLKPNQHELAEVVGTSDVTAGARHLIKLGSRRVLVSLGADGMLAFAADQPSSHLRAHIPGPLPGNPTGAGDAAVAAAAVVLLGVRAPDLRDVLLAATAWSAAAVLMPQAGAISGDYADLERRLTITEEPDR